MYNSMNYQTGYPQNQQNQAGDVSVRPLQMNMTAAKSMIERFGKLELHDLQEDDEKLDDLIKELDQVKDIQTQKESLMASNQSLAEYNLSLKPQFLQLKGELAASYEELQSTRDQLLRLQSQFGEINSDQQSPELLLALLQTETAKTEEESEKIAQDYIDKVINVDKFLEDFITSQSLFYNRQFKVGKMKDLLQNRHVNPAGPAMTTTTNPHTWYQNTAPYPGSYMPMPDPYNPYNMLR